MRLFFLLVFIVLSSLFLLEYHIVGQAVYGDGRYYWSFTRSLYFSQNIDISSEMGHFFSPESNNKPASFGRIPTYQNKTKEITHSFSLGISVIWLPFFLLADAIVVLLRAFGVPVIRNGYSDLYQIIVGIGNIGFMITGLFILSRVLLRQYSKPIVLLTLTTIVFATNLVYYGGLDVINSHPFSFLGVALLLWLTDKKAKRKSLVVFLLQGIVVGLLAANRTQDVLFLVLPVALLLIARRKIQPKQIVAQGLWLVVGVGIGYLPQLLLLSFGQGHLSLLPHTDQGFSLPTHMLGILFDQKLGIVWYMPVFLVGVLGLCLIARKQVLARVFLFVILLHYLLISSWDGWHQASYTMRYFISLLPLIAFGIAEVFQRLSKRYSLTFLMLLVGIFILHQALMILGFKLFLQDATNVGGELSRSGKLKMEILQKLKSIYHQP